MSISTAPSTEPRARPAPTVTRNKHSNRGRAIAQIAAPIAVFILVLLIWLFISYVLLDPRRRFLMPPPQDVVLNGLLNPANFSEILAALWSTTQVAIVGLAVAIVIGTIIPVP